MLCRPIDFLGIDDDRLTIMCIFGAAAGSIVLLIVDRAKGNNAWETGMNYNILYSWLVGFRGDGRSIIGRGWFIHIFVFCTILFQPPPPPIIDLPPLLVGLPELWMQVFSETDSLRGHKSSTGLRANY